MNARAKEFVWNLLKASASPLAGDQLFNELQDYGFHSVTRAGLMEHLESLQASGDIQLERIPGRSTLGWALTHAKKRKLGLLVIPPKEMPISNIPPIAPKEHPSVRSKLWRWQDKALLKWEKAGCRGIVEAVTGSGKTVLGLAACERMLRRDHIVHSLVVVPSIVLMEQWQDRFERDLPGCKVGLIGDGHKDDFRLRHVCIATVQTAVRCLHSLFEHRGRMKVKTLLIADECHHYIGPPIYGKLLEFPFDYTLGLSATVDAGNLFDNDVIQFRVRGLGVVIERYTFGMAVNDGHVPPFVMVNIPVTLVSSERHEYDAFRELVRDQMSVVTRCYEEELRNLHPSQDKFWRTLKFLQKRGGADDPVITRLFVLMFKRAAISYKAEAKMRLAREIVLLMLNEARKKVIVFFERIQSAQELRGEIKDEGQVDAPSGAMGFDVATANKLCSEILEAGRNWCQVMHCGLTRPQRKQMLQEFRETKVAAMLACRVLDEGFDVPEIDVAILVASTKSARQRIQRIGRALRKGDGHKKPIVITLYVPETGDADVVVNDKELFGDAATIYQETETACMQRLRQLVVE